jgi:hypothetical protein
VLKQSTGWFAAGWAFAEAVTTKWINLLLVNNKVYSSGAVSLEYAIRPIDPRADA